MVNKKFDYHRKHRTRGQLGKSTVTEKPSVRKRSRGSLSHGHRVARKSILLDHLQLPQSIRALIIIIDDDDDDEKVRKMQCDGVT